MNGKIITTMAAALLVQGCGTLPQDRTVSGAGLGAATGAVIGAVTTMAVLPAAAIGAAAGALTGALTGPEQVNLGKPAWKHGVQETAPTQNVSQSAPPPAVRAASDPVVADIQSRLTVMGYDAGPVDGMFGPKTAAAIRRYQMDHGLPSDGRPSVALADRLRQGDS
jgi:hypothetical protein